MDEKVLEEFQFHKDTVVADVNSPLHLIREKEMEISGRILAAKKEAEEIVASARRKAVEIVQKSEAEGEMLSAKEEERAVAEVEREIAQIAEDGEREVAALRESIGERVNGAADHIVGVVTRV